MSFDTLLNIYCDIQTLTTAQDATTGQMVKSYANKYASVPCRLDGADGTEEASAGTIQSRATHVLFLRTDYKIDVKDRINIGSVHYNILLITDAGGHKDHQELLLELIK